MEITLKKSKLSGEVIAPPSKSYTHRALICAGLACGKSVIGGISESEDVNATLDCIEAMGAVYVRRANSVTITGNGGKIKPDAVYRCRESGSTLRFFIPIALLSGGGVFSCSKRLIERGIGIYTDIFDKLGIEYHISDTQIELHGKIKPDVYTVRGNVSSQFITGLLLALPLLEENSESEIRIIPPIESKEYIAMTLDTMRLFGVNIKKEGNSFIVKGGKRYSGIDTTIEGDWSNAAFFYAIKEMGNEISIGGLNADSIQGDRICIEYFKRIKQGFCRLDISDCPDLGPVLFAFAAANKGAEFTGTERLSIKECDRAAVMAEELAKFGIETRVEKNSVTVYGGELKVPKKKLYGNNDHRIVMADAVLALRTSGTIVGCEAVRKSFPNFFEELKKMGAELIYD